MVTPQLLEQENLFDLPEHTEWVNGEFVEKNGVTLPTDLVEDFFAKAEEYLTASCVEVWLIIPKIKYIFVITDNQCLRFKSGDIAKTEVILTGFSVTVDELLN